MNVIPPAMGSVQLAMEEGSARHAVALEKWRLAVEVVLTVYTPCRSIESVRASRLAFLPYRPRAGSIRPLSAACSSQRG